MNNKEYERTIVSKFNIESFNFVEEGLPLPIFYGNLFNREHDMGFDEQKDFYLVKTKFLPNEDLVSEKNQSNGENKFNFKEPQNVQKLKQRIYQLIEKLKLFINGDNLNSRLCFLGIPSSDSGVQNIPQFVAKTLNSHQIIELIRTKSKSKTHHESTGHRQVLFDEIIEGIELVNANDYWWTEFDFIILIDDVTTTGSSFRMMDKYLMNQGVPKEKIINYAMYKHQSVENFERISRASGSRIKNETPIDGVIWDFDETIVDSRERDVETEHIMFNKEEAEEKHFFNWYFFNKECIYEVYPGLSQVFSILTDFNIPYAIVSNRYRLMSILFKQKILREQVFPKQQNNQIKFYETKQNGQYENYVGSEWLIENKEKLGKGRFTKPSPETVLEAISKLKTVSDGRRIIGIGNTQNDIIAYRAAGIETVLVTWGIKYQFGRDYGADHVFNNPKQLLDFLQNNISSYNYSPVQENWNLGMVAEPSVDYDEDLPF